MIAQKGGRKRYIRLSGFNNIISLLTYIINNKKERGMIMLSNVSFLLQWNGKIYKILICSFLPFISLNNGLHS